MFNFHNVFDSDVSQQQVYASSVAPAVRAFLQGRGSVVVARGTQASGKSRTFFAVGEYSQSGCCLRAATDVLDAMKQSGGGNTPQLYVSCVCVDSRGAVDALKPNDGERMAPGALAVRAYSSQKVSRVSDFMLLLQRLGRRSSSAPRHTMLCLKISSSNHAGRGQINPFLVFLETASEFSGSAHNR